MDITANQVALAFVLSGAAIALTGVVSWLITKIGLGEPASTLAALAAGLVMAGALVWICGSL